MICFLPACDDRLQDGVLILVYDTRREVFPDFEVSIRPLYAFQQFCSFYARVSMIVHLLALLACLVIELDLEMPLD